MEILYLFIILSATILIYYCIEKFCVYKPKKEDIQFSNDYETDNLNRYAFILKKR